MHLTAISTSTHNGPVCGTCGTAYLGTHKCSSEQILRRIKQLADMVGNHQADSTAGCPCRPENGGSGVCGCVLGGPRVTC